MKWDENREKKGKKWKKREKRTNKKSSLKNTIVKWKRCIYGSLDVSTIYFKIAHSRLNCIVNGTCGGPLDDSTRSYEFLVRVWIGIGRIRERENFATTCAFYRKLQLQFTYCFSLLEKTFFIPFSLAHKLFFVFCVVVFSIFLFWVLQIGICNRISLSMAKKTFYLMQTHDFENCFRMFNF